MGVYGDFGKTNFNRYAWIGVPSNDDSLHWIFGTSADKNLFESAFNAAIKEISTHWHDYLHSLALFLSVDQGVQFILNRPHLSRNGTHVCGLDRVFHSTEEGVIRSKYIDQYYRYDRHVFHCQWK